MHSLTTAYIPYSRIAQMGCPVVSCVAGVVHSWLPEECGAHAIAPHLWPVPCRCHCPRLVTRLTMGCCCLQRPVCQVKPVSGNTMGIPHLRYASGILPHVPPAAFIIVIQSVENHRNYLGISHSLSDARRQHGQDANHGWMITLSARELPTALYGSNCQPASLRI